MKFTAKHLAAAATGGLALVLGGSAFASAALPGPSVPVPSLPSPAAVVSSLPQSATLSTPQATPAGIVVGGLPAVGLPTVSLGVQGGGHNLGVTTPGGTPTAVAAGLPQVNLPLGAQASATLTPAAASASAGPVQVELGTSAGAAQATTAAGPLSAGITAGL